MKINIIGGGPAGLYFAILMKKADPSREIAVYERNAPEATFGWGVVFSDRTLSYLEDNDPETCHEITKGFETWDNVDIVHRDEKISVHGNRFTGIARIKLLNILQERCRELGVDLAFRVEIQDPTELASADLLVGADGVNSAVRTTYQEAFEPSIEVRPNAYIWYGTDHLFHGLTLTFRESEAGVFAAHSYKFSTELSTFIVECDPETWRAAGFAEMDDAATRAYLERVFERDLDGRPLLSNNSNWIHFLLVKNRRWYHENVVLLGDALHTAHFSIGSGTKLALEDSIALAECFAEHPDVPAALAAFEARRKPVVDALQEAARDSMIWFESVRDYVGLDPMRLAFSCMTRSNRIDYENLRRRDPEFVAAYEKLIG